MYRNPKRPGFVVGKRRSYGESIRNEALRLKMSAPVKVQKSSKVSGSCRKNLCNIQRDIQLISISRINDCKDKVSTSNVDVVGRKVKKVDDQSKSLMLHNSRSDVHKSSQDVHGNIVKSRIAVSDEVKKVDGQKIYLKLPNSHPDAIHIDEWTNAYISERNGLKMKISRKRKHEEVQDGSDVETNGTSPLNTPLSKNINGTSPLNTPLPLPKKVDGLSPLNTPLSKNVNGRSPLNTPLPKKTKLNVI